MALPGEGESINEILNAHTQVWNDIYKFILPMSLKCAIELGIPDIIKKHGKPITLSELISALPVNKAKSHCIYRLMRVLVHFEYFVRVDIKAENEQNEGYWLTPFSNLLLTDSPFCLTPFLHFILDPHMMRAWNSVSEWLADDCATAYETAYGLKFWDQAKTVGLSEPFNEAMANDARFANSVVLKDFVKLFEGVESLVDVGGGTGLVAKAIADAFPEMRCTVFDLPHVVSGLEGSSNLSYIGGDMLEEAIPNADVVLLKNALHIWDDDACVKILKKCREVIPGKEKGGKVIIFDSVLGYKEANDTLKEAQLFLDMTMMVFVKGKERSEKEWEKLFLDAGFSSYKISHTLGVGSRFGSIIEVYP